ncbi:MAG: hypothetical protein DWQ10_15420 [Calditrichaeota bacterium]|nr:MAG: hypothetical protein DWQ10_15420 [Calditrichota bacterium]
MRCSKYSNRINTLAHPYSRRDFLKTMSATTGALPVGGVINSQLFGGVAGEKSKVSVATATSYDSALLRQVMENMINDIGGLSDIIKTGDAFVSLSSKNFMLVVIISH